MTMTVEASRAPEDTDLFRALRSAVGGERERVQDLLVRRHTGLVHWLVARYAGRLVDADELRAVANVGLVLAIQRFDPERGIAFVSYARPTVQGEIRRYFRDKRRWVQLPRRLQETKMALRPATETLTHRLNRAPTVPELAAHLGVDPELVLEAMTADDAFAPMSLDIPVRGNGEGDTPLGDTIALIDERFDRFTDLDALRPLLAALTERERRILHLRFVEERTQREIGLELGVSQMQISRLLSGVLGRLRAQLVA